MKSSENKNKLIIDDYAAEVVRDIFKWKLEGLSQQGIADRLNENGILSPMEYKRFSGLRFTTTFKINHKARWSAVAVGRILRNEVYIGVLEQGKRVTPNYKIKQRVEKPKNEWVRVENAHDPIIEKDVFDTVAALLKMDTRIAAKDEPVYMFSGVIVCGDCKRNMVRKTVPKGDKKYYYFSCSTNRDDKTACTTHSINERDCESAVFLSLKAHIDNILNIDKMLRSIETLPYQQDAIRKLEAQISKKQEEIERYSEKRLNLYEDYRSGIVTRDDYISFKKSYDTKIYEAESAVIRQREEIESIAASNTASNQWIEKFKEYRSIDALNRKTVAELIERIYVYDGGRIYVVFRYQDEYDRLLAFLKCKEAV